MSKYIISELLKFNKPIVSRDDFIRFRCYTSLNTSFTCDLMDIFDNYSVGGLSEFERYRKGQFDFYRPILNFAVSCSTYGCGVNINQINQNNLVGSIYKFHVIYHIRRILNRLKVVLPTQNNFNRLNVQYDKEEFNKICNEYDMPKNKIFYYNTANVIFVNDRNKGYGYFNGIWGKRIPLDNYQRVTYRQNNSFFYYQPLNRDSWNRWIMDKPKNRKPNLSMISESIRTYVYLVLTSQSETRHSFDKIPSTEPILAFNRNFELAINGYKSLKDSISSYQNVLKYAQTKVNYSIGKSLYMIPSNMNLRIGKIMDYNNNLLISDKNVVGIIVNNPTVKPKDLFENTSVDHLYNNQKDLFETSDAIYTSIDKKASVQRPKIKTKTSISSLKHQEKLIGIPILILTVSFIYYFSII